MAQTFIALATTAWAETCFCTIHPTLAYAGDRRTAQVHCRAVKEVHGKLVTLLRALLKEKKVKPVRYIFRK